MNKKKRKKNLCYFNNNKIEKLKLLKINHNINFSVNSKIHFLSKNNNYYNNYDKETKFLKFYRKNKLNYLSQHNKETRNHFFLNHK